MPAAFARLTVAFLCVLALAVPAFARTIVVAQANPAADDGNAATEERPLKTIQAGAELAQPGDVVLVHAGTYRERVIPPRGGTSEQQRITYRAAPGEQVSIRGSDRITTWKKQNGGLWLAELEAERFGDYNPYERTIRGEWLDYGEGLHRGDVYLDGTAYSEKRSQFEAQNAPGSWYCVVENGRTRIWANFGDADPNQHLAEINVRHAVFFPEVRGLKYITLDGFTVMHSAENWGPPGTRNGEGQWGAIGTRFGYAWIIENCTVINAKCIGICLGVNPFVRTPATATAPATASAPASATSTAPATTSAPTTSTAPASRPFRERGYDINTFGHHIVRNNHLIRCGQAGIGGDTGAAASLIEHNLVEYTNDRGLFGGDETAGIKFHFSIDAVLRNNVIHSVGSGAGYGGFGIWLDFGNQNTRVTGNVIYDTASSCLFIEASHGPILVDNNVFIGKDINAVSESQIFVHNLFYRSTPGWSDDPRRPPIWVPHAARQVRSQTITPRDDKWLNNIFIGGGMHNAPEGPGFVIDYNVYLDGAKKSRYDEHSLVEATPSEFHFYTDPNLVAVDFCVSPAAAALAGPRITSAMLGKFPMPDMLMENPDGTPIEVAADFFNQPRTPPSPSVGPFANLPAGMNSYTLWSKVTGDPRPYRITVTPADAVAKPGQKLQLSARAWDQNGKAITPAEGFIWEAPVGSAIDRTGQFTAGPGEGGPWRITAKLPGKPGDADKDQPVGAADVYVATQEPGLAYAYYEGIWQALPDFTALEPAWTGTTRMLDLAVAQRPEMFALRFDGRLYVPAAGSYTFYLTADDGAKLYLDGAVVVDNDGGHAIREASGTIELKPGLHTLAVAYFQNRHARYLSLDWQAPGLPRQGVPASVLFLPAVRK